MKQVVVGGLEQSSMEIISTYFKPIYKDLDFKILGASGIAGVVSRAIVSPDTILIILEESVYASIRSKVKTINNKKVYCYSSDEDLEVYCQKLTGVEPTNKVEEVSVPPDLPETPVSDSYDFNKPVLPDVDETLPNLGTVVTEETNLEVPTFNENDTTDLEAKISELDDKLAQKDVLIRNLEQQIQEMESGSSEDEKELIAEIKRLNTELSDTKQKLEESISASADLDYNSKAKIEFAEKKIEELNELKQKVDSQELAITGYKKQIDDLAQENENLTNQINDSADEISDLTTNNSEYKTTIEAKERELEGKIEEITLLQEKLNSLGEITTKLTEAESTISDLNLRLSNKDVDIADLNTRITEVEASLKEKVGEYNEVVVEKETLTSNITSLEEALKSKDLEIESINKTIAENNNNITELNEKIETLSNTIAEKSVVIENKEEEIETLTERLTELRGKVNSSAELSEELSKSLKEQEEQLKVKEEELKQKTAEFEAQKEQYIADKEALEKEKAEAISSSANTSAALDKLLNEKKELEDKLVALSTEKLDLDSEIERLNASINAKETSIEEKDTKIKELETEVSKANNTISSLQIQVSNAKSDNEHIKQLENDLLEEKRKVNSLTSELDVMKKIDDSGKVADLKIEVAQLKHKLEQVSDTKEIQNLRKRNTHLELQLAEIQSKEKELGVFSQMFNISKPKLAFDCKLSGISNKYNNIICLASGSSESTYSSYQIIKKTCQLNSNKRFLIIDLTADSFIDREFAPSQISSPIEWLQGSQPFTKYCSNTRFNNVKVISTGLAYLNDLSLLQVDWQSRLNEVSTYADVIFIHIGCLISTVTKVLFNTFNSCMRTNVVVKATPINLRTVILAMTGFITLDKSITSIYCVNYDKSSEGMYKKLASKYNTSILLDNDAIQV